MAVRGRKKLEVVPSIPVEAVRYVSPFTAQHLEGELEPAEQRFLAQLHVELAWPFTDTPRQRRMLERGLLGLLPTLCGPALVVSTLGCRTLGMRPHVIGAEGAGNVVYLQRAVALMRAEGYETQQLITPGQLLLHRGGQVSVLMARISGGGYRQQSIVRALRHPDVQRSRGEVIVCVPVPGLYARLVSHHSRLRVCALAPWASPTTVHTAPVETGISP